MRVAKTQGMMQIYKKTSSIIFISLFVIACSNSKQKPNDINNYVLDSTTIAVLKYDTTLYDGLARLELQSVFRGEGTKFELISEDFKTIDLLLFDCINEINVHQEEEFNRIKNQDWFIREKIKKEDMLVKIEDYKRQYIPVILNNGEKEVFVNCFPSRSAVGGYWKDQLIFTLGGGARNFSVYINLTTNKYRSLYINAPM